MKYPIGTPVIVFDHDDVEHRAYIVDIDNDIDIDDHSYIINTYNGTHGVSMNEKGIHSDYRLILAMDELVEL